MVTVGSIDYASLVLGALREAIAGVVRQVAEHGLPGEHQLYITFDTTAPGVEIPPGLRSEHPEELTIVLQYQFWDLEVDEDGFSVTLRFAGVATPLRVPFSAMTAFADPSVDFGVQLAVPGKAAPEGVEKAVNSEADNNGDSGRVIAFDRDRKRD